MVRCKAGPSDSSGITYDHFLFATILKKRKRSPLPKKHYLRSGDTLPSGVENFDGGLDPLGIEGFGGGLEGDMPLLGLRKPGRFKAMMEGG